MAKFYVQSGTFRRVVAADSSRKAALWAVHEVMQQILPTDHEDETGNANAGSPRNRLFGEAPEGQSVTVLSAKVRVDERGFDRSDATEVPTMEVVAEWNQMVMTLDRLQRMLDGSGAADRTLGENGPVHGDRFSDDCFSDDLAA